MLKIKKMNKVERFYFFRNLFYIIVGSISLAFGTGLFLTELNIVSGGLSGIAIIAQYFIDKSYPGFQAIDIIVFVCTWLLWFVGFFFVGKEFAFKTLVASIAYPLALSLFLRVPLFVNLSHSIATYGYDPATASVPIGNLLLNGIFGGVFIGVGVAMNFKGGGSTGGVDVFIALANKYFGLKESIVSFAIDSIVIICGMFIIPGNIVPSLCGIISAFVSAIMIEYFYIGKQTSFQADIISDKWEEISRFVQDKLGRGATIIDVKGGYKQDERIILRVVFDRTQYKLMRECIGRIDPKAFMTFTQTFGVYGEGFKANEQPTVSSKKKKK